MNDTGSRLALLPPCLSCSLRDEFVVVGDRCCDCLVHPSLLGAPSAAALDGHAVRRRAAGLLLATWAQRAVRSVRLEAGRLWPELLAPEHVVGWAVEAPEAQQLLVATAALGERYQGWQRALRIARRELAEEGSAAR